MQLRFTMNKLLNKKYFFICFINIFMINFIRTLFLKYKKNMNFDEELAKYMKLAIKEKRETVIRILVSLEKFQNEDLKYTHDFLISNENVDVKMYDEIYEILLDFIIKRTEQDKLDSISNLKDVNLKLKRYLQMEKEEKEDEDLDKMLIF